MKNKLGAAIFAAMMILGIVYIGDAVSSNSPFSAQAQVVTVKRKKKVGITRRVYRGGKWVTVKTWKGGKWVAHKTKRGTKYVFHKSKRGVKKGYRVTKRVVY